MSEGDATETAFVVEPAKRPAARPVGRGRFTLAGLMTLVAIFAADFAAITTLLRVEPAFRRGAVAGDVLQLGVYGLLMILYDLLIYFSAKVVQLVTRRGPDGRPSRRMLALTALVLGAFAAPPLVILGALLLRR